MPDLSNHPDDTARYERAHAPEPEHPWYWQPRNVWDEMPDRSDVTS